MNALPEELVYEVFKYLSPGELMRCSETCSNWKHVADQSRLWKSIDLSLIGPNELKNLAWNALFIDNNSGNTTTGTFLNRLNKAQEILIVCPSYIGPKDLKCLHLLLMNTSNLKSLALDRIQLGEEMGKLFECLPQTLETVSLRQTLVGSNAIHSLLRIHGHRLKVIDLSYTSIDNTTLEHDIVQFCTPSGKLQELYIDGTFKVSNRGIWSLLVNNGPTSLKKLSVKYAHFLRSQWLMEYMNRQINTYHGDILLECLWLDGCDLLTLRDIKSLISATKGNCWISHSAILEDDTLEGYMDLIDRIARGIVESH